MLNSLFSIVTLWIFASGIALAQVAPEKKAAPPSKTEQAILKCYAEWDRALTARDGAALQRLLSKDHSFTTEDGVVMNRDGVIAGLASEENVIRSCRSTVEKVRVYGKTAVVMGVWKAEQQTRGKDSSGSFRFTDTWIKAGGTWQRAADHVSRLSPAK